MANYLAREISKEALHDLNGSISFSLFDAWVCLRKISLSFLMFLSQYILTHIHIHIHTYVYIYEHVNVSIFIYICKLFIHFSLTLTLYIYIYIFLSLFLSLSLCVNHASSLPFLAFPHSPGVRQYPGCPSLCCSLLSPWTTVSSIRTPSCPAVVKASAPYTSARDGAYTTGPQIEQVAGVETASERKRGKILNVWIPERGLGSGPS